jgi:predicted DCC family thiol-disulfide oxidoreductase YuxK
MTPARQSIIYFDGLCNLCDGFVRFLLARDKHQRYRFAPLQGETARVRLAERFVYDPQTIVLEEPKRFRVRSDAALAILTGLGGVWRLTALLRVIPRRFRDALYNFVARKRLEWYGRRDACRVPTEAERERFLP